MNIKMAKEQIINSVKSYFTKDRFGSYIIPIERQRPLLLIGPPGIGKTAVMEQVAAELGVGLVTYSMTHHTRQSALGLPFIEKKNYGGVEYSVSEYTMSEIIASMYDMMENTGVTEGILFLDEINCVSETLAPSMLQFLQYKIFGRHRIPDGWVVVTAGNPPEYNNSVREFDIVTWDRLKRVNVEADFEVWKEYAYKKGVHGSVMSYLEIKKNDFYKVETTVDGKSFVTARGWVDLSDMMKLYEMHGFEINEDLVGQYIQDRRIAKDFSVYYDLWLKYKSEYQIVDILEGRATAEVKERARKARFDERLALLGLLLDGVAEELQGVHLQEETINQLLEMLKSVRAEMNRPGVNVAQSGLDRADELKKRIASGRAASTMSHEMQQACSGAIAAMEDMCALPEVCSETPDKAFMGMKKVFDRITGEARAAAEHAKVTLSNVFRFCEEVFGDGQETVILTTELTINSYGRDFISRHGCEEYYRHNKDLLFCVRHGEIESRITAWDL